MTTTPPGHSIQRWRRQHSRGTPPCTRHITGRTTTTARGSYRDTLPVQPGALTWPAPHLPLRMRVPRPHHLAGGRRTTALPDTWSISTRAPSPWEENFLGWTLPRIAWNISSWTRARRIKGVQWTHLARGILTVLKTQIQSKLTLNYIRVSWSPDTYTYNCSCGENLTCMAQRMDIYVCSDTHQWEYRLRIRKERACDCVAHIMRSGVETEFTNVCT